MLYNVIAINQNITPVKVSILFGRLPKEEAYTLAKIGRSTSSAKRVVIADDKLDNFFLKIGN